MPMHTPVRSASGWAAHWLNGPCPHSPACPVCHSTGHGPGPGHTLRLLHPPAILLGLGRMLIEHDATTSFPSFHATFLFSLALPLLAQRSTRGTALTVGLLGIGIAWARIFVGVHYPFDMAGAFVVSAIAAGAACATFKRPNATP